MRHLVILFVLLTGSHGLANAQAYWRAATGPYGGTIVSSLATMEDGSVFAATVGGLFRSDDDGATWVADMNGIPPAGIDVRALQTLDDGTLIAATYGGGLFTRAPGSDQWASAGGRQSFVTSVDGSPDGTLYAGTIQGIMRSEDRGGSWLAMPVAESIQQVRTVSANNEWLFVGTSIGVYRSPDRGHTWEYASMGMTTFDVDLLFEASNGDLYSGTSPIVGGCTLFRSRSSGRLWTCVQPSVDPLTSGAMAEDDQGRLYFGGYRMVYRSDDQGTRWQPTIVSSTKIQALATRGSTVLAGTFGRGVARSTNRATSWTDGNHGLYSAITDVAIARDGSIHAGTLGGVYRSDDMGANWDLLDDPKQPVRPSYSIAFDEQDRLLDGTRSGLYRYNPLDNAWEDLGPPGNPSIRDMTFGPDGDLYLGYWEGVYHLRGRNWESIPLIGPDQTTRDVIAVKVADDGTIYAGGAYDSFMRRPDASGWVRMSSGLSPYFESQAFAIDDTGALYAGTRYFGVMKSRTGGQTWTSIDDGLAVGVDVRSIVFDLSGVPHIGTFGDGVFRLNGTTWNRIDSGMEDARRVTSLEFDGVGNAYAATYGSGLFIHSPTSTASEPQAFPTGVHFSAPWPNPTDGTAWVASGALPGPVEVAVYDLLGRRIAHAEVMENGGRIRLPTEGLARGLYAVRLQTGDTVATHVLAVQ